MTVIQEGQVIPLQDAINSLTDSLGNKITFEKQEDGSYVGKSEIAQTKDVNGKVIAGHNFTYILSPRPTIVDVSVKDEILKEKTAEEKKAIADAKLVAENAPDLKTKKEAQSTLKSATR